MLWHFCSKRKINPINQWYRTCRLYNSLRQWVTKEVQEVQAYSMTSKLLKDSLVVKYKVHYPTECSFPDLAISKFVVTKIFSLQKLIPNLSHIHKETFKPTIRLFCPSWQASKLTGSLSINRKQAPVPCAKRALLPREVILILAALFCSYFRIIYH